jgi:hypothetical protein
MTYGWGRFTGIVRSLGDVNTVCLVAVASVDGLRGVADDFATWATPLLEARLDAGGGAVVSAAEDPPAYAATRTT